MAESSLDLTELEKLRSADDSNRDEAESSESPVQSSHKWQILLEPFLLCSLLAFKLQETSLINFYLRTACSVDLNYSFSICNKGVGEEFRSAELASQVVVAGVNISKSFIGSLISTIVLLFVGPWSDCSGRRKPLLILPVLGMSATTTTVLLLLIFPGATAAQVLYMVQIPLSLGGNLALLMAASYSYIGDVCHVTGRDVTSTMGTHQAAVQLAYVVGSVCGPLLYQHIGFYGVFSLVLFLQVSSLIYVLIMVKDINVNRDNKVSIFNWRLPFSAIQCLFKKREGYKRVVILLLLVIGFGNRILITADMLLSFMYYRYKFRWDDLMFGLFLAYRNTTSIAGILLILTVLKRRLLLSNETVGMLSCISYILSSSCLIATTSTIFVFIIPVIGIISQGTYVVHQPLMNKQVLSTELGKIYSVFSALETAIQMMTSPLYALLYKKSVSLVPDAWLIPGIILTLIQLLSYFYARKLGQISL